MTAAAVWKPQCQLQSPHQGPWPRHSAAADLGEPSGAKLALLPFQMARVVSILSWGRKGGRLCIQRVKSRGLLVRAPRNWNFCREHGGRGTRKILFCVCCYYPIPTCSLGHMELHTKRSGLSLCVHQGSGRRQAIVLTGLLKASLTEGLLPKVWVGKRIHRRYYSNLGLAGAGVITVPKPEGREWLPEHRGRVGWPKEATDFSRRK